MKKYSWLAWMVGLAFMLATLAVGTAMASGALAVPFVGVFVNKAVGWVVIITSVISVVGAFIIGLKKLTR